MSRILAVLSGLLIVYGSLYPFDFIAPTALGWQTLWQGASPWSSRGDMLGNLILFLPWGMFGTASLMARRPAGRAMLLATLCGLLLAVLAQLGQLMVPQRTAALADVVWNMFGCLLGLPVGRWLFHFRRRSSGAQVLRFTDLLLVGCIATECLPFVPSLDWALVKAQLRGLLQSPEWSLTTMMDHAALQMVAGWALAQRLSGWHLVLAQTLLLSFLMAVKLFMVQSALDVSLLVGAAAGAACWLILATARGRLTSSQLATTLASTLLAMYTLGALAPFALRDSPTAMGWLPLAGLLEGNMLENSRTLMTSTLVFAGILAAARSWGAKLAGTAVALAIWALVVESLQCWIATRSGDVTAPVLVLLAGLAVATMQNTVNRSAPAPINEGPAVQPPAARNVVHPAWALLGLALPIVVSLHYLLRMPGIPYNVVELFRADGQPAVLGLFALALLWLGSGPAWLGRWLAGSAHPAFLPLGALGCSLVALALVWGSVTDESLGDIAGSTNLVWFVTHKDLWGTSWRNIFHALDMPGAISFIERCVRWSALYGPLPLMLGALTALTHRRRLQPLDGRWTLGLLVSGGLTMWLCKAVAFDWSSTDNLNELIAPDGPWGWGGGSWLYVLLLLLCLNAWALARCLVSGGLSRVIALVATAMALPAGWWLLNAGLNPAVEKYGNVFSGAQFLLGPDRKNLLSPQALMLRWYIVQAASVGVISAGLWLEAHVARWREQRR